MSDFRRYFGFAVATALMLLSVVAVVPRPASALSSQLWTTDADWNSGIKDGNLVLVGTGTSASLEIRKGDFPDWTLMAPGAVPPARESYCLAWIAQDNSYLMFGGAGTGGPKGDTWRYNFTNDQWTQIFPSNAPSARSQVGCAYDHDNEIVVLFGGLTSGGSRSTETWWFYPGNNSWFQKIPSGAAPRNLESTPMVYDRVAKKTIMVALNSMQSRMETWAYDSTGNSWTSRSPSGSLSLRDRFAITYDVQSDRTFLFSGAYNLTFHWDWWNYGYSSNSWTLGGTGQPNVDPNPRVGAGLVYRDTFGADLLFGGQDDGGGYPPETYLYAGPANMWFLAPGITATPGGRVNIGLAHSPLDDATLLFGGYRTGVGYLNDTWALAKGYFTGFDATWTSSMTPVDAGCDIVDYKNIWFNATKPAGTIVRFQFATATSPAGPWTFVGPPNGLPGQHYQTSGDGIWSGHDGQRFFRVLAKLKTLNTRVTPSLHDITITWDCPPDPPEIINTNPAHNAQNHPLAAPIWVNFSEGMDTPTVQWTISGSITLTSNWYNNDQQLKLTPTTPFLDCTNYTVQITQGKDKNDGFDLVAGPVPNPWTFRTVCVNPYIVSTDPAHNAAGVPLDKVILVNFSEPMNTGTVAWTISGGITLTGAWNGARTQLSLSHTTPFATCTVYVAQVTAGKDDQGLDLVAGPAPNPWTFTSFCPNPYIVTTDPADGETGVPLDADIVVTFSEPMNITPGVLQWTIAPGITLSAGWNPAETVATLSHTAPFLECTVYTVTITAAEDKSGLGLVPGPVPNPWSFTTVCIPPYIVSTDPPDGQTGVPVDKTIVVDFSEPMNTGTVAWTISGGITLTGAWNGARTQLSLSHTTPFAPGTLYTARITAGKDDQGLDLVAGPVPNPWSFTTYIPLTAPTGLVCTRSAPSNVNLDWQDVVGAVSYRVYESQNRFAAFPSGWTLIGSPVTSQFPAPHLADGLTHFYVVRASDGVGESGNSTMCAKKAFSFTLGMANTNIAWFSLPYVSEYATASDIANQLTSANIDLIGKWDPVQQRSIVYYFARGKWRGTNFAISAGDGLYLGVKQTFTWAVVGTDRDVTLTFTHNAPPKKNVYWTGIPYTGVYATASDISDELGSAKISEVGLWDPATQTSTRWYWTGSTWTGTDFTFAPGAGIYVIVVADFTWAPTLVTPWVP